MVRGVIMPEPTTVIMVIDFLQDYRDNLIGLDFTRETSNVVTCCDVILDRLELENELRNRNQETQS